MTGAGAFWGGACGWVVGRAGLWGVLPTCVWVGSACTSPLVPGHPISIYDIGVNIILALIPFSSELNLWNKSGVMLVLHSHLIKVISFLAYLSGSKPSLEHLAVKYDR